MYVYTCAHEHVCTYICKYKSKCVGTEFVHLYKVRRFKKIVIVYFFIYIYTVMFTQTRQATFCTCHPQTNAQGG